MRTRRLTLRRESLAALTTDELAVVAGAAGPTGPEPTPPVYTPRTVNLDDCFVLYVTGNCPDITFQPRCF